jgi:hypothetical protein
MRRGQFPLDSAPGNDDSGDRLTACRVPKDDPIAREYNAEKNKPQGYPPRKSNV